jgi:hypothetical protein
MSDWNKYIKQFISNGNKVEVKKVKKPITNVKFVEDEE